MIAQRRRRTRSQQANGSRVFRPSTRQSSPADSNYDVNDTGEDELEVIDELVSLIDPISKQRIRTPVRSESCEHPQCFDLTYFLDLYRLTDELFYLPDFKKLSRFETKKKQLQNGGQLEKQRKESGKITEVFEVIPSSTRAKSRQINYDPQECIRRSSISPNSRDTVLPCPVCRTKFKIVDLFYDDFTKAVLNIDPSVVEYVKLGDKEVRVVLQRPIKGKSPSENRAKSGEPGPEIIELEEESQETDSESDVILIDEEENDIDSSEGSEDSENEEFSREASVSNGSSKNTRSLPTPSVTPTKGEVSKLTEQSRSERHRRRGFEEAISSHSKRQRPGKIPALLTSSTRNSSEDTSQRAKIINRKPISTLLAEASDEESSYSDNEVSNQTVPRRRTQKLRKSTVLSNPKKSSSTIKQPDIIELSDSDAEAEPDLVQPPLSSSSSSAAATATASNRKASNSISPTEGTPLSSQDEIRFERHSRKCRLHGVRGGYNVNKMSRATQYNSQKRRNGSGPSYNTDNRGTGGVGSRSGSGSSDSSVSTDTILNMATVENNPDLPFVISDDDDDEEDKALMERVQRRIDDTDMNDLYAKYGSVEDVSSDEIEAISRKYLR